MPPALGGRVTGLNRTNRVKEARKITEEAIQSKKIFYIQGKANYATLRRGLRERGWVERFDRMPGLSKKRKRQQQPGKKPSTEEDEIYNLMSRLVFHVEPTFIWTIYTVNYRLLSSDQMSNHFRTNSAYSNVSFTTKVGLCNNMHTVPWFVAANPQEFFPRCYRLIEEEKEEFIDDFRITACICILKVVRVMYADDGLDKKVRLAETETQNPCINKECTIPNKETENLSVDTKEEFDDEHNEAITEQRERNEIGGTTSFNDECCKKNYISVPRICLDRAIAQCEKYVQFCNHEDIDQSEESHQLCIEEWNELITWYYQLVHEDGRIPNVPSTILRQIDNLLNKIKTVWPQYDLDGIKNVWIVKPEAMSRGRAIACYDHLEDMLKQIKSGDEPSRQFVVQKYIERPLLIYSCKFDIRQWFLVTDWNPLTVYFYRDSYLRFCSQTFTLSVYHESIHLSNNAVQSRYENGPRPEELPEENMWSHEEFSNYIKSKRQDDLWNEIIYPCMKKAVICALLSSQEFVEHRKASFELYGADFMLTEDYKPWLIEINSSPSMSSSTNVTTRLCANVLEDTLKVVLDRKLDKNCDIGRFESAFKHTEIPKYTSEAVSFCIEGHGIKKPGMLAVRKDPAVETGFQHKKNEHVTYNYKLIDTSKTDPNKNFTDNQRLLRYKTDFTAGANEKFLPSVQETNNSSRQIHGRGRANSREKTFVRSQNLLTSSSKLFSGTTTAMPNKANARGSLSNRNNTETSELRKDYRIPYTISTEKTVKSASLAKGLQSFVSGVVSPSNNIVSQKSRSYVQIKSDSPKPTLIHKRDQSHVSRNNSKPTDQKEQKVQAKVCTVS